MVTEPGAAAGAVRESFVCPRCGRESWHPHDVREGYCGWCHDWTSNRGRYLPDGAPAPLQLDLATLVLRLRHLAGEFSQGALSGRGEELLTYVLRYDLPRIGSYVDADTRDWVARYGLPPE